MSMLADKTERKALMLCARAIRVLDKERYLDMTKTDDWQFMEAKNNLQGIIQSNGYEIIYPNYQIKRISRG